MRWLGRGIVEFRIRIICVLRGEFGVVFGALVVKR